MRAKRARVTLEDSRGSAGSCQGGFGVDSGTGSTGRVVGPRAMRWGIAGAGAGPARLRGERGGTRRGVRRRPGEVGPEASRHRLAWGPVQGRPSFPWTRGPLRRPGGEARIAPPPLPAAPKAPNPFFWNLPQHFLEWTRNVPLRPPPGRSSPQDGILRKLTRQAASRPLQVSQPSVSPRRPARAARRPPARTRATVCFTAALRGVWPRLSRRPTAITRTRTRTMGKPPTVPPGSKPDSEG